MLKFLTRAEPTGAEDVTSAETAEAFWRSLADEDAIEAQHAICDALAAIKGPRGPELNRLRGLLVLQRRSESLLEGLLSEYVSPNTIAQERERKLRQAIVELVRSFAHAFEYFLRHIRDNDPGPEWHAHAASVLVHLFGHREIDLLLALYRYDKWPRGRWKDLFSAYEFASTHELTRQPVGTEFRDGRAVRSITLEQSLIRALLLQHGGRRPHSVAVPRRGRRSTTLPLTRERSPTAHARSWRGKSYPVPRPASEPSAEPLFGGA